MWSPSSHFIPQMRPDRYENICHYINRHSSSSVRTARPASSRMSALRHVCTLKTELQAVSRQWRSAGPGPRSSSSGGTSSSLDRSPSSPSSPPPAPFCTPERKRRACSVTVWNQENAHFHRTGSIKATAERRCRSTVCTHWILLSMNSKLPADCSYLKLPLSSNSSNLLVTGEGVHQTQPGTDNTAPWGHSGTSSSCLTHSTVG